MKTDWTWRKAALKVIAQQLPAYHGLRGRELRAALNRHYPFGPRKHWPYRVWLRLMGEVQNATDPWAWLTGPARDRRSQAHQDVPGQLVLFEGPV